MEGKIVLITGGNNGICFETSLDLAKRGAQLIIGCRNTENVTAKIQCWVPGSADNFGFFWHPPAESTGDHPKSNIVWGRGGDASLQG